MLQKCANPACNAPFRSLREGKMFLAESPNLESQKAGATSRRKLCRREHFWLCPACSALVTLRFDAVRGMTTVPLPNSG